MLKNQEIYDSDTIFWAVALLSQQLWCWGQDISRPEGNRLLQVGFDRIPPPEEEKDSSSSVYRLNIPGGRNVILRGFGVFYGDEKFGGVFFPRYEFLPRYTPTSILEKPPWLKGDLPSLALPSPAQRIPFVSLVLDLIEWIRIYEMEIVDQLGVEYRRSTLDLWDDGRRLVIPAEEVIRSWRLLGIAISADSDAFIESLAKEGTSNVEDAEFIPISN